MVHFYPTSNGGGLGQGHRAAPVQVSSLDSLPQTVFVLWLVNTAYLTNSLTFSASL